MKYREIWGLRESWQYPYIKRSYIIFIFPSSVSEIQGGFKFIEKSITSVYTSWYCYSLGGHEHLDLSIPTWEAQTASPEECPVMYYDRWVTTQ